MAEPSGGNRGAAALAAVLDPARPVCVQTHDFPDLDAVASAWALAELLSRKGFDASCAYRGRIRSRSLQRLVLEFRRGLDESRLPESAKRGRDQLVVIDGSPANGNVRLFPGDLAGVIDHHRASAPARAPYLDLRPELASCSTIVWEYWKAEGLELPADLATALIAGIQSDTDFLSRRASDRDFAAYTDLYRKGDFEEASRIVRTVFDLADLSLVTRALASSTVRDGIFWAWLEGDCAQEVLAVLAEFVLRTDELRAAIVAECASSSGSDAREGSGPEPADDCGIHLSVRSKDPKLPAFDLVRSALEGIGTGGGHSHSAGGFVPRRAGNGDAVAGDFPGNGDLRERFFAAARHFPA